MHKGLASILILTSAVLNTSAVAADALAECYRTADNRLKFRLV